MKNKPTIVISTKRLILRTWTPEDVLIMARISSDLKVMEFFPYTQDLKATEIFIAKVNEHFDKYGYGLYAVETKDTNELIGFVGLNRPSFNIPNFKPQAQPIVEIGWRLSSHHWDKGYATEAAKAVLEYAFKHLDLGEIISFTTVQNIKSQRVMEKIGLMHDKADDFNHPKISEHSPLSRPVLYKLSREKFIKKHLCFDK